MSKENKYFTQSVISSDPEVTKTLDADKLRQQNQIELIASENMVSRAVLDALGHEVTNKTLEGYPGKRFHGGGENVDVLEQAVVDRAKKLFNCEYVNSQPHSGTQANQAVFFATLVLGDKILSLDLAAGGHLSHGAKPNLSGRWFDSHYYQVDGDSGRINYIALMAQAQELKPKLLIAGGSAYPREFDFPKMREIADSCGALLLVDMAHFAGLVAAGVHPSPIPHADIVTSTTTKTLRGPRGGLILSKDDQWSAKLQSAIFPGVQGSLHTQIIAAKAVCLGEALREDFRQYGKEVKLNAAALADSLSKNGINIVSGGIDTHIVLLDLRNKNVLGQQAQDVLMQANITSNKNPIPFDSTNPANWVGLRLGSAAATTRGLREAEFVELGETIATLINSVAPGNSEVAVQKSIKKISRLCEQFPIYT